MQDEIVEPPGSHEPTGHAKTPKKAAASGWIGSALEYYDFAIYGQAAALIFPAIFFPPGGVSADAGGGVAGVTCGGGSPNGYSPVSICEEEFRWRRRASASS
jgi:hypothetical protein